jgi:hypothetical protein
MFRALEAALLEELAPVGALQAVLAQRVVSAAWRLLRADRMEAEVLEFRGAPDADLGLSLIRDGNGTRSVETVMRYRNAAMAELLRAQKTLQALQAPQRAEVRTHAAAPSRQRRARPSLAERNEPERSRQINGSTQKRNPDRPAASAPKTSTPKPGADLSPPRRSPDLDGPNAAPTPLASPPAGTKRTRESTSNQLLEPRASQRPAA